MFCYPGEAFFLFFFTHTYINVTQIFTPNILLRFFKYLKLNNIENFFEFIIESKKYNRKQTTKNE